MARAPGASAPAARTTNSSPPRRDQLAGLQVAAQAPGHLDQHRIAHAVALGVVDLLEFVQVDEEDREHPFGGGGVLDVPLQRGVEAGAVGQLGQVVEQGQLLDARQLGDLQGDVLDGADHAGAAAGRVAQRAPALAQHPGRLPGILDPVADVVGAVAAQRGAEGLVHVGPVQRMHPAAQVVVAAAADRGLGVQQLLRARAAGQRATGQVQLPACQLRQVVGLAQQRLAFAQRGGGGVERLAVGGHVRVHRQAHVQEQAADQRLQRVGMEVGVVVAQRAHRVDDGGQQLGAGRQVPVRLHAQVVVDRADAQPVLHVGPVAGQGEQLARVARLGLVQALQGLPVLDEAADLGEGPDVGVEAVDGAVAAALHHFPQLDEPPLVLLAQFQERQAPAQVFFVDRGQ